MKKRALVTGASSGIGKELARIHAAQGGDLVIVARRSAALDALKDELEAAHNIHVHCVAADLTDQAAPQQLYDHLREEDIEVDYLLNNAGFGGHGYFHERGWSQDEAMIQLNVAALTELTHLFLPDMIARGSGKILNTASTAGFMPGPLQAVYYATKAYVVSFSQAIDEECRSLGVDVTTTALCPGPVATEFVASGDLSGVDAWQNAKTPESVARVGYEAMQKGKLIAFNEWKLKLLIDWILPFLPRRTVLKTSRQAMEKSGE